MEVKCDCESHEIYIKRKYSDDQDNGLVFIETKSKHEKDLIFYYCYCEFCLKNEPIDTSCERFILKKEYIVYKLLE
jgi:hypothetical protein